MRDDLKSLRITDKELQDLTNLPVDNQPPIITDSLYQLGKLLLDKVQGSEGATVVFISSSVLIFTYLLFDWLVKDLVAWITLPSWILLILTLVWLSGVSQGVLYLWWKYKTRFFKKNMTSSLKAAEHDRLLNEALQIAMDVKQEMRKLQD